MPRLPTVRQAPQTPSLQQIVQVASEFGVSLRPIHPGEKDPLLALYLAVDSAKTHQRSVLSRGCTVIPRSWLPTPNHPLSLPSAFLRKCLCLGEQQ